LSGDSTNDAPVAVITGAGSGVGRATALRLASRGWRCGLLGRTRSKLEATAAAMDAAAVSLVLECDLGEPHRVRDATHQVLDAFGRIDAVLNIAGIAPQATIEDTDEHLMRSTLEQNLVGPTILVGTAWPSLAEHHGVVVNVSSMSSIDPFHHFTAYAASKSGLDSLSRSIMAEAGETGIRAFTINPGAVETPLLRSLVDEATFPTDLAYPPDAIAEEILRCIDGERDDRVGRPFPMVRGGD
jgi:NAD(P)-dependent dehydrogenase (short-subunit alcohol dehydrogenase family)